MGGEGILSDTLGSLNQGTDGINLSTQLILTRAEHGSLDFDHVVVTVDHTVDGHIIAILQLEVSHVELINIEDRVAFTILTHQADGLLMGIAGKATGIFQ